LNDILDDQSRNPVILDKRVMIAKMLTTIGAAVVVLLVGYTLGPPRR
jgi:hypothetical protein